MDELFRAQSKGGKHAIVVFQTPQDVRDKTYIAQTYTSGRVDGGMTGYNLRDMRERIKFYIRDLEKFDKIKLYVISNKLGVEVPPWAQHGEALGGFDKSTLGQWRGKPFRKPDVFTGGQAIWYGPDGPEGENATVAEFDGDDVIVEEYQYVVGLIEEPDADYIVQRTYLKYDDIIEALEAVRGRHDYTNLELLRWAAGLGVAKISYWGGEESWVDELPR